MSAEASSLLEKAQLACQQAERARRLANETSALDVAAQLREYADELDQRATALEERAAVAAMPRPTKPATLQSRTEGAAKGEQPRRPARPK